MKTIVLITCIVATASAVVAAPFELEVSPDKVDTQFADTSGKVEVTKLGGTQILAIADGAGQIRDIPVKSTTKHTLTIQASFAGDVESIEENPRFEIFTQLGQTSPRLPSRTIEFFDADGKRLGNELRYAMPFRNRQNYVDVFYTPPEAAAVRVTLASGKPVTLHVASLKLHETADEGALNINPSFQLGRLNYSGWQRIRDGGKLIETDGKTILDTKYGSTSQPIPLVEPGTYAISAKATGNGYNSVVILRVYDAEGKQLMQASTRRYGPKTYFVAPEGAAYASFLVYSCLLEEVRLIRMGGEQAIQSLRK